MSVRGAVRWQAALAGVLLLAGCSATAAPDETPEPAGTPAATESA